MGAKRDAPPSDWTSTVNAKREDNIAKMAPRLVNNNVPMDYHGALGAGRTIIKERPDAILVNEGANALDLTRGVVDMYQPRKRLDVGTWGVMGIGMGQAIAAAVETGQAGCSLSKATAPSASSGMEVETICRYSLPICIVVFNNGGIYRGTDVNAAGADPATTVFVPGARYDKMMEAFGGVGVNATSPDELKRAVNAAMDSGKPALINAVHRFRRRVAKAGVSAISNLKACYARNSASSGFAPLHKGGGRTADQFTESDKGFWSGHEQGTRRHQGSRFHPCAIGTDLHSAPRLVRRRRHQQGGAARHGRRHARPVAGTCPARTAFISRCSTTTNARSPSMPRIRAAKRLSKV